MGLLDQPLPFADNVGYIFEKQLEEAGGLIINKIDRFPQAHSQDGVMEKLPVVIVACQVFERMLENILPADLAGQITFLDYGLHSVPKKLAVSVQAAIDAIAAPSLVVLGYGLCGNGLNGIKAGRHTLLIPRTDDCIALLLGSYQSYQAEFTGQPGTYWLSKGWLEAGTNPLAEYRKCVDQYDQETAAWVMDQQYQHYRRLALVAHNQADLEAYRAQAQEVADYCGRWNMTFDEVLGSDAYVRKLVAVAADITQADDDFLLIPPGGELKQSQFVRGF